VGEVLLIRVDAGSEIGMGHAMRCLALAQAWQDVGGSPVFAMASGARFMVARLHAQRIEITPLNCRPGSLPDAQATARLAAESGARWVVIDGYHLDSEFQRRIKNAGLQLLCIDDEAMVQHYWADIVLNQNLHAAEPLYTKREPYTQLLLNTRYVLLRREFGVWRNWLREVPPVARNLLVMMGGADPENSTLKVLRDLRHSDLGDINITIVAGDSNPNGHALNAAVPSLPFPITLKCAVDDMPSALAWADAAISAGGSSCWELAYMGVPTLILVLSRNQIPVATHLHEQDAAWNLGPASELKPEALRDMVSALLTDLSWRSRMASAGRALVDGAGASRVVAAIRAADESRGAGLRFRKATSEDCRLIWEWANDDASRAVSFSSDPIPWNDHVDWFCHRLADPNRLLLVSIDSEDRPVGYVRFDITGGDAVISLNVSPLHRGIGLGPVMIRGACEQLLADTSVSRIYAYIKPANRASISAFTKASFIRAGRTVVKGQESLALVLDRKEEPA
jgi:UDP-2,4-diacetamido-2,4,6-trideoxy-beta-L-altropyranose hydrolase